MKNLFFAIFALIAVSCTKENTEQFLDKTAIKTENNSVILRRIVPQVRVVAKEFYYDVDFKNYFTKSVDFIKKVNFKANMNELSNLETENQLDSWISSNINKTRFKSIDDYQNFKNEQEQLKTTLIEKFKVRLESLKNIENVDGEFLNAFNEIAENEIKKNDEIVSENACYNAAEGCLRRAQSNAAAGVAASMVSAWYNPIVAIAAGIAAKIYLHNAVDACMDAFDNCMGL